MLIRLFLVAGLVMGIAACDPILNTNLTPEQIAQREADRDARNEFYRGPRGGATGR